MVSKRFHVQGGFSLIEALVGVAIIGITAALIPPVVTLSVAARAQNQRVEQAVRLAQGHMDLVRLRMERGLAGGSVATFVADVERLAPLTGGASLNDVAAPGATTLRTAAFCDLDNPSTPIGPPCRVDIDGDGQADFGLQAFRIQQQTAPSGQPLSFIFGVRVYPRAVVQGVYAGTLGTRPAQVRLGAPEAASNPLAVQYSRILVPDSTRSLGSICRTLGGDDTNCALVD
ncbi:Prokaryotic N-terminal methylation motif domain protein [Gloeomargarita lithophora Alchichica-D10]|uniref:Prokaryotic N-terminal methylation motif domain protein n=1 Tax=Gloeomargarita lithophora Alchichica-D10 TaxID=1188229 RepID=A0A1J0AG07_9CYAN|nr:type II secretion system protein [Gloeomargarita lithophora]APB34874.1 Prokaryotic N-terminal methylation motif domain protein [Gloeomargarita lithophora Alchichica-D10]